MRPIPTSFNLGPLELHTYGIGLALTFWFAYRYFERRLQRFGYRTDWVATMFTWVVVSALIGARVVHVLSQAGYYADQPLELFAVWHGGLSSFGGLLFAVPTAIVVARRRCPELGVLEGLDIVAPVLMAAWAIGRLLGPQLMVAGGGRATEQWFGMYYEGQVGKRVPVPLIQAAGDALTFLVLITAERRLAAKAVLAKLQPPRGAIIGLAMVIWGTTRAVDERLLLGESGQLGSTLVQLAGMALVLGGLVLLARARAAWRRGLAVEAEAPGGQGGAHGEDGR